MVLLREYRLDLRWSQPEPLRVGILRKPCYIELYYLSEDGDILGMLGDLCLCIKLANNLAFSANR